MKTKSEDWLRLGRAVVHARDNLRGRALPELDEAIRAAGDQTPVLEPLVRLRVLLGNSANTLTAALKDRSRPQTSRNVPIWSRYTAPARKRLPAPAAVSEGV